MTHATTSEASLVIDDFSLLTVSGARNTAYLIPAAESPDGNVHVTIVGYVGSGTPERAWHGRWMSLVRVPAEASEEGVTEIFRAHADDLLALAASYEGSRWDGNNHVGSWSEDGEDVSEQLREALEQVPTYWDAGEYLATASSEVAAEAIAYSGTLAAYVAREVERAAADGALIRELETRDAIVTILRERGYDVSGIDDLVALSMLQTTSDTRSI